MEMKAKKQIIVLADAPHHTPKASPYLYVRSEAPSRAVLYSHEDMTAAAVSPVPTERSATMNLGKLLATDVNGRGLARTYVSVDLLSSLNAFFMALVTQIMPGDEMSIRNLY
jgi:hypothetical protein